jgi:thioredoxin 1
MSSNIVELDDTGFEREVEQGSGLVFVDFWAPWCAPCRIVAPVVEKLAAKYAGRVRFAKVNVDQAQRTASAYGIASIPTLAIFRDGRPVSGIAGAVPERYLTDLIEEQLVTGDAVAGGAGKDQPAA